MQKPVVVIHYCTQCNWLLRSAWCSAANFVALTGDEFCTIKSRIKSIFCIMQK